MKSAAGFDLAHLPTPLEPMARLSGEFGGPELWIKRDDQTGLASLESAAKAERVAGQKPYVIPYGGSNAVGASAYALAFEELWNQATETGIQFDRIAFASSSGGTQAGLVVGAKGNTQAIPIRR